MNKQQFQERFADTEAGVEGSASEDEMETIDDDRNSFVVPDHESLVSDNESVRTATQSVAGRSPSRYRASPIASPTHHRRRKRAAPSPTDSRISFASDTTERTPRQSPSRHGKRARRDSYTSASQQCLPPQPVTSIIERGATMGCNLFDEEDEDMVQNRHVPSSPTCSTSSRYSTNTSIASDDSAECDDRMIQSMDDKLDREVQDTMMQNGEVLCSWAKRILDVKQSVTTLQLVEIPIKYAARSVRIAKLYEQFASRGLVASPFGNVTDEAQIARGHKFGKLNELCASAMYALKEDCAVQCISNNIDYGPIPNEFALYRFSKTYNDTNKLKSHQYYLLTLIENARANGLRRYKNNVVKQILTEEGHPTHAWEVYKSIKDYVYECSNIEIMPKQWYQLTESKGNAHYIEEHLTDCKGIRDFPFIEPDRGVYAFKNGIYFLNEKDTVKKRQGKFVPYDQLTHKYSHVVANKFINIAFDDSHDDWRTIPTPNFTNTFTTQKLDETVIEWCYVMIGRMLHGIKKYDNWQTALLIKGIAGSGKSTLGHIVADMFNSCDIHVHTCGNHEKEFGMESFLHKFAYICQEISESFGMPQDILQSLIAGDIISVARKNKTAEDALIDAHGLFTGNKVGNWSDNADSIVRRFLVVEFLVSLTEGVGGAEGGKPNLRREVAETELANIIQKVHRAYMEYTSKYAHQEIWKVLPPYFTNTRKRMKCLVNSLMSFMQNSGVITKATADDFIPLQVFLLKYRRYCRDKGVVAVNLDEPENVESIFREFGAIITENNQRKTYQNAIHTGRFISGIKFNETEEARVVLDPAIAIVNNNRSNLDNA